jgi:PleD family two-component response regulator
MPFENFSEIVTLFSSEDLDHGGLSLVRSVPEESPFVIFWEPRRGRTMNTATPTDDAAALRAQIGPVRVVIVDDHELVRLGVAQLINRERGWNVCGEAADPRSGLQLIREKLPHLALIDLRLKEGDGLELVKQVRQSCPDI